MVVLIVYSFLETSFCSINTRINRTDNDFKKTALIACIVGVGLAVNPLFLTRRYTKKRDILKVKTPKSNIKKEDIFKEEDLNSDIKKEPAKILDELIQLKLNNPDAFKKDF